MKASEAPPPGWYPDPEGRARLRWWEGTDWSDRFRARPPGSYSATPLPTAPATDRGATAGRGEVVSQIGPEAEAIVAQVQQAARAEAERAANLFAQRAREATGAIPPLITQYTSKIMRYMKFALFIVFLLFASWLAFQIFAQKSFFDWLGDRIDNITDRINDDTTDGAGTLVRVALSALWRN